jgi:Zn-dependent protease with chaperone function
MTVAVYLPLLLAPALTVAARWIAERGAPAPAARALVAAALVAAVSWAWSLLLLALTLLDDVPPLAVLDDNPTLDLPEPVPGPVALAAGLLLAWAAVRLARDAYRRHDTVRRLRAAGLPQADLVVADWAAPLAAAVPGRPGHLLVTTGILKLLDADGRRVVFAHERSHLAHRHHRLAAGAAAAAAINPLLAGVRGAVAYLIERWADEDAARAVGDRELTARAVARAALATTEMRSAVLGMNGAAAVLRVRALREPAPAPRLRRLISLAVIVAGCVATAGTATVQFVTLARAWL